MQLQFMGTRGDALASDGLGYIARVTLPYLVIMIGFVLLLTLWPGIVTILPRVLYG